MGSIVGRVHQRGRGHTWYGSEGGGGFDGCRDGRRDRCRGKCGHPPWSGGSAAAIRGKWCRRGDHGNVGGADTQGIRVSGRRDHHRGKMGRGSRRWQLNGEGRDQPGKSGGGCEGGRAQQMKGCIATESTDVGAGGGPEAKAQADTPRGTVERRPPPEGIVAEGGNTGT